MEVKNKSKNGTEFIETLILAYNDLSIENKVRLNDIAIKVYKKYENDINSKINNKDIKNQNSDIDFNSVEEKSDDSKDIINSEINKNYPIPETKKAAGGFLKGLMSLSKLS